MGEESYNVFISWSGTRSKWVAEAIRGWLPMIVQAARPWMSATDIDKGTRGLSEVSGRLQGMKVGISCLTPENQNAPWILYEAGALSKTIDDKTRLCTYLLGGLQFQDVKPPLGMFQATNSDKQDTHALLRTINRAVSENPVPLDHLDHLFDRMWPELEEKLSNMPKSGEAAQSKRSTEDMMAELLSIARAEADNSKSVQEYLARIDDVLAATHYPPLANAAFTQPWSNRISVAGLMTPSFTMFSNPTSGLGALLVKEDKPGSPKSSPKEVEKDDEKKDL